ncbi:hypothetical protein AB7M63_009101 [Bradyrhizobium japonicum]
MKRNQLSFRSRVTFASSVISFLENPRTTIASSPHATGVASSARQETNSLAACAREADVTGCLASADSILSCTLYLQLPARSAITSSRLGVVRCGSSFVGWFIVLFFLPSRKAAQNSKAETPIAAKQRTQSLDLRNLRSSPNAGLRAVTYVLGSVRRRDFPYGARLVLAQLTAQNRDRARPPQEYRAPPRQCSDFALSHC